MLELNCIKLIIEDILATDRYTPKGIAFYSDTYEDVIYELAAGRNTTPTINCFKKIMELHQNIRKDLYIEMAKKNSLQNI